MKNIFIYTLVSFAVQIFAISIASNWYRVDIRSNQYTLENNSVRIIKGYADVAINSPYTGEYDKKKNLPFRGQLLYIMEYWGNRIRIQLRSQASTDDGQPIINESYPLVKVRYIRFPLWEPIALLMIYPILAIYRSPWKFWRWTTKKILVYTLVLFAVQSLALNIVSYWSACNIDRIESWQEHNSVSVYDGFIQINIKNHYKGPSLINVITNPSQMIYRKEMWGHRIMIHLFANAVYTDGQLTIDTSAPVIKSTGIRIPFWEFIVLLMIYPTIVFYRGPLQHWRRSRKGLCIHCGYNLTGNTTGICSECGTKL